MIYLHSHWDDAHSRCFTLSDHLFVQRAEGACVCVCVVGWLGRGVIRIYGVNLQSCKGDWWSPPVRSVFVCQVRDNGRRHADKGKDEELDVLELLTGSLIRLVQMSTLIRAHALHAKRTHTDKLTPLHLCRGVSRDSEAPGSWNIPHPWKH